MQDSKIEKRLENSKMARSVQVWWSGKLVDIISDEEARKIVQDGNAIQIAENMIKISRLLPC
jgi:hypothetical protein